MEDVRTFLLKHLPEGRERGRNYFTKCLWCGHDELVIDLETGKFVCNRKNNCAVTGNLITIKEKLGIETKPRYIYKAKSEYTPIKKTIPEIKEIEMPFFTQRGINQDTIKYFKVYESKYNNQKAYCFPYFYQEKLANIKYRLKDKKFYQEKDNYSTLWNIDNVDYSEELIIVEGEMDCMSLWQSSLTNVVSVPSGASSLNWIDNNWEELERFSSIALALDNDKAGNEATDKISLRLGKYRCKRMIFKGFKDANEACMAGYADCLWDIIKCEDIKPKLLLKPTDILKDVLSERNNPDYSKGDMSGLDLTFNSKTFNGYFKRAITIWSGVQGHGKTTMVFNEMAYQMVFNQRNVCIASLEMSPVDLIEKLNRQIKGDNVSDNETEILAKWLNDKLVIINFIGTIEPDVLLEHFEYSAKRFGTTHFVIDNLMKIKLSPRDHYTEYKEFINKLTYFARKFDCHVHLVAHQKKQDDSVKYPLPKVHGIFGSSEIANASDNVFLVHRIDDDYPGNPDKFGASLIIGKQRKGGDLFTTYLHYFKKSETFDRKSQPDLTKFMKRIVGR